MKIPQNENKTNIFQLINYIKSHDIDKKDDYLIIINDALHSFVAYFNTVVDIEIFVSTLKEWTSVSEYMYRNKDENRRLQHDECIHFCNIINDISEKICYDLYINTKDRHEVACFIGDTLNNAYSNGINRSFDELVKDYSKSGKNANEIDIIIERD